MMNEEIKEYSWWGNENSPPENLKTKKQLSELNLKPIKPVGVIKAKKYDLFLYDINNPESVVAKKHLSDKQKANIEKLAQLNKDRNYQQWWEKNCFEFEYDKWFAIEYCRKLLTRDDWIILDLETTGLNPYADEIVEICIIDHQRNPLLNTLINPQKPIPQEASDIHNITDNMIVNAPKIQEIWNVLKTIIKSHNEVLIYNKIFDVKFLIETAKKYKLPKLGIDKKSTCMMETYSEYINDYSEYHEDYKWQPLNGGHRALDDCFKVFELIELMGNDDFELVIPYPDLASDFVLKKMGLK